MKGKLDISEILIQISEVRIKKKQKKNNQSALLLYFIIGPYYAVSN